jgi:hypothetical protein
MRQKVYQELESTRSAHVLHLMPRCRCPSGHSLVAKFCACDASAVSTCGARKRVP